MNAQDISRVLEKAEYDMYGLRILNEEFGAVNVAIGDTLPPSFRWEDGCVTDEELLGTSAVEVDEYTIEQSVARLMREYKTLGRHVVLIGGHSFEYGEDAGEVIIKEAKVLAIARVA